MKHTSPDRSRPPRAAEWILKALHSDHGDFTHLGDFAESYGGILTEKGRTRARLWCWDQILRSLPGFAANRLYWSLSMLRNYAVISCRNIVKNFSYSFITIMGLAVGLACFILILAYARFESSYDSFHEKADRIYRILSAESDLGSRTSEFQVGNPSLLAAALRTNFPEVRHVTRVFVSLDIPAVLKSGEKAFTQKGLIADQDFFEVFSFPLLRGDKITALAVPASIVITEGTARKLFGDRDPLGQTISYRVQEEQMDVTVTGVVQDVPRNSHLRFDYIGSLATMEADKSNSYMFDKWNVGNFCIYMELSGPAVRKSLEEKTTAFVRKVNPDANESGTRFVLQAVKDIHLRSNIQGELATNNEIRTIYLFLTIAILILLIASINYTNLVTARASARAREIGIRKAAGANRRQLFQQFLGESVFFAGLALVLALSLVRLALPRFSVVAGVDLRFADLAAGPFLFLILGVTLVTGILSGVYPALVLSAFQPARVLKDFKATGRRGSNLRNLLVVGQFAASIVFTICALVVAGQLRFIRSQRLGFDREHVVIIPLLEPETKAKAAAIKTDLLRSSEVESVSVTSGLPTRIRNRILNADLINAQGEKVETTYHFDYVDEDFLKVFEIDLASGRNFNPGEKDVAIVNETLMKTAGWTEIVGREVPFIDNSLRVVGVVKDFYFQSFHNPMEPMVLILREGKNLAVRIRPGDVPHTIAQLKGIFEKNSRSQPWDFFFFDDDFNALYRKERRTGEIFGAFAGLAVLIACLGLLGLAAFAVERRTKEIGIRRVMGASVTDLTVRLSREFVGLVLAANVIAWPIAHYAMSKWLQGFAYRNGLSVWAFILAAAGALLVAFLTVSTQTFRAAASNPVNSLRYE